MRRTLAAGLVAAAILLEAAFLLGGAGLGAATAGPLPTWLVPWVAHPGAGPLGGVLFAVGVLLAGRRGGERFATLEVVQLLATGGALGCGVALVVGVGGGWSLSRLGAVAVAGLTEAALAVALAVRAWRGGVWRRDLFLPGLVGACGAATLWTAVVALGARG